MSQGVNCMREGAATDAGASAVISSANPMAVLRQIETSSNTIVRIPFAARGILRSKMTSIGEPPVTAQGDIASGLYLLRHRGQ